jgi:hypothetical protein
MSDLCCSLDWLDTYGTASQTPTSTLEHQSTILLRHCFTIRKRNGGCGTSVFEKILDISHCRYHANRVSRVVAVRCKATCWYHLVTIVGIRPRKVTYSRYGLEWKERQLSCKCAVRRVSLQCLNTHRFTTPRPESVCLNIIVRMCSVARCTHGTLDGEIHRRALSNV